MSAFPPGPGRLLGLVSLLLLADCAVEPPTGASAPAESVPQAERIVMAPSLPDRIAALALPELNPAPAAPAPSPRLAAADAPAPRPEAPAPATPIAPSLVPPAAPPSIEVTPPLLAMIPPSPRPAPETPPPTPIAPQPRRAEAPEVPREETRVQLVAAGSEAEAMRHWARVRQQVPKLVEERSPIVVTLERPDQPTIWRLRVGGFATAEAARRWCDALRERRVDCWVSG